MPLPYPRHFEQDGQLYVEYPDGRIQPATTIPPTQGQPVPVSQGGTRVPVSEQGAALSAAPDPSPAVSPQSQPGYQSAPAGQSEYVPRTYSPAPPAYGGGGYSRGESSQRGGYSDSGGGVPRYADGTSHPAAFGDQRDLAGLGDRIRGANGQPPATDGFQHQISVPGTGASAGPFGPTAPSYAPRPAYPDRGGSSPGGGGGAPSLAGAMAQAKSRIQSALGSGGSSYSSASYPSFGSYTPAEPPEPEEPKMRGLAKGMDPLQAASVGLRPTMLLPAMFPQVGGAEPLYQNLADMPAAQLGILSKRGYDGGPSDLVNAIGSFYQKVGGDNWMPDFDTALRNLTTPKQGGGIDEMFSGVKARPDDQESFASPGYVYGGEPPSAADAAYQYAPFLDAALSLLPQETAMKYGSEGYGGFLMDQYGAQALKRPAGRGKPITTYVGRRLMR